MGSHTRKGFFGQLALGDIPRSSKPFREVPLRVEQGNCARKGPAERSVKPDHTVFQLESALAGDGFVDGGQDEGLVVRVKVFFKPARTRVAGIGDKILAFQVVHFAPVGTHAIDDIGSGRDEGPEALRRARDLLARQYLCRYVAKVTDDSVAAVGKRDAIDAPFVIFLNAAIESLLDMFWGDVGFAGFQRMSKSPDDPFSNFAGP